MSAKEDLMNRVPEGVGVTVQTLVPTEQDVPFANRGAVAATSGLPHTHRAGTSTTSRTLRPS